MGTTLISTSTLMIAYKIGMRDGIGSLKDKVGSDSTVLTTAALLHS